MAAGDILPGNWKISEEVIKGIASGKNSNSPYDGAKEGWLMGLHVEDMGFVFSSCRWCAGHENKGGSSENDNKNTDKVAPQWKDEARELAATFPAGMTAVGIFSASRQRCELLVQACQLKMIPVSIALVVVDDAVHCFHISADGTLGAPTPVTTFVDNVDWLVMNFKIPIRWHVPLSSLSEFSDRVQEKSRALKDKLWSSAANLFIKSNGALICDSNASHNLDAVTVFRNEVSVGKQGSKGGIKGKVEKVSSNLPLSIELLYRESSGGNTGTLPVVAMSNGSMQSVNILLEVNVLAYSHPQMPADRLCHAIKTNATAQLDVLVDKLLESGVEGLQSSNKRQLKFFHFKPLLVNVPFTALFSIKSEDDEDNDMLKQRAMLHFKLNLKKNRPLFRVNQAWNMWEIGQKERLRNPHVNAKRKPITGGQVYLTEGVYDYHHYMQDKFNDNGWGCAYRSLQTIVSWFVLQGYKQRSVPSIPDIQKMCVTNDVRKSNFVGSKEWIGSMEVGWALQWCFPELDLQIKYITSVMGSDIVSKSRELAEHFQKNGTPVMIGGNNLAHTILGIDFNEKTGEVQHLILDPHYTGPENLRTVLDKGWCGWKDLNFWNPHVTYNMCLPQRPMDIY
eukprot:m.6609 g.6609  ORF g.6609 m.6609 type:complete len:621 (+) comp3558_c0_seq1:152-2014(+)